MFTIDQEDLSKHVERRDELMMRILEGDDDDDDDALFGYHRCSQDAERPMSAEETRGGTK